MDRADEHYLYNYSKGTKNVCICVAISILLILIFIVSPLNNFFLTSMCGKTLILSILAFALYKNIETTFKFSKNINMFQGDWNSVKTNVLLSYLFSAFIVVLIFSVLNRLFR